MCGDVIPENFQTRHCFMMKVLYNELVDGGGIWRGWRKREVGSTCDRKECTFIRNGTFDDNNDDDYDGNVSSFSLCAKSLDKEG